MDTVELEDTEEDFIGVLLGLGVEVTQGDPDSDTVTTAVPVGGKAVGLDDRLRVGVKVR